MRVVAMTLLAMLSALPTRDLARIDGLVGSILDELAVLKAAAQDPRVEGFRRSYVAALEKILRGRFDRLESAGVRGALEEIMAHAERTFGPEAAEELRPYAERYLQRAFRTGQALEAVPDEAQVLWDRPRKEAVDWLVAHDRFWIGKVFPSHLSADFRQTVVDGLKEGLGRKDIAKRLRQVVMGRRGVPAKLEYYRRIAAVSVNRARNWGGMFSLEAARVQTYTWRAAGDERTCSRCSYFNGQSFSTASAMSLVRRALEGPAEGIAELAPWPREDRERDDFYIKTPDGREYIRDKSTSWLQEHGMGTPPLHANCRCVIVAEVG
jgi:SPP1 gp7 family putative phage head morphogenesis protein